MACFTFFYGCLSVIPGHIIRCFPQILIKSVIHKGIYISDQQGELWALSRDPVK